MSEKLRESITNELLSILVMEETPNIISIDCALRAKYSKTRPWPFKSAEDAATCFRDAIARNQKAYGEVTVAVDNDILTITLNAVQSRLPLF